MGPQAALAFAKAPVGAWVTQVLTGYLGLTLARSRALCWAALYTGPIEGAGCAALANEACLINNVLKMLSTTKVSVAPVSAM